jgi:IS30 family transposase
LGKDSKSAVGTLVERSTRYVLLLHLPDGRSALEVEKAMKEAIMNDGSNGRPGADGEASIIGLARPSVI